MTDVANETVSAEEFREQYGAGPADQATLELGEEYDKVVAVDPGTTTGVAHYWGETPKTETKSFWDVYVDAQTPHLKPSCILYVVEAPYLRGIVHERLVSGRRELSAQLKIAQNSGGVQREAELLVEGLRGLGYDVVEHDPDTSKKWGDDQLRSLIDWNGPSNEHTRDALLMLVAYGFLP